MNQMLNAENLQRWLEQLSIWSREQLFSTETAIEASVIVVAASIAWAREIIENK